MLKRFAAWAAILVSGISASAGEWPQFRGPFGNGSTDEKGLPVTFSQTQNVVWSADLPGPSAATPAIWQDHVFINSTDTKADTLVAMAFDRKTGKPLWQQEMAKGITWVGARSNYASPTPATDGKTAVFFQGNGEMAAYDFAGNKKWQINIEQKYGAFAFQWTFSTSPVFVDGRVILQVLQRDVPVRDRASRSKGTRGIQSYLLALEPETGNELWKHVRPCKAVAESRESFATPVLYETGDKRMLLVAGGDDLTAHDPATGKELWRWGTWNPDRIPHWRLVPSPVAGDSVALVCAPKGDPVYAIAADRGGLLDDSAIVWKSKIRDVTSDVPTPAFYDGDFFVLSDNRRNLCRVHPKTGEVKWKITTPGRAKYEASPLAADGKIYIINFSAEVSVIDAETGKVLHTVAMDEPKGESVRASVSAAHGQLFVRTNTKLFCIAN